MTMDVPLGMLRITWHGTEGTSVPETLALQGRPKNCVAAVRRTGGAFGSISLIDRIHHFARGLILMVRRIRRWEGWFVTFAGLVGPRATV